MPVFGSPSPEQIRLLLTRAEREGMDPSIIDRLTVILQFAEQHYSISEICRQHGISRSTFHRWMERFNPEDLSSLADKSHEAYSFRPTAVDAETVEMIRRYRMRYVQMGKEKISELLRNEHGVDVSPSSVGRIIDRECLFFADTPLHWKKRMAHRGGDQTADIVAEQPTTEEHHHIPVMPEAEDVQVTSVALKPRFSWKTIKRVIIVSSVVTNIAFVSMLMGMALFERKELPANTNNDTAQILHAAPSERYLP